MTFCRNIDWPLPWGKNCFISVSHLLTCLLYAILKLFQGEGQTPLPYRVTTIHPHLPPRQLENSLSFDARLMKLCRNIDWPLPWRFRKKEATSRRKGGTRTDTPALQGYHHSPPPSSPLISSAFALWANAELYILGPSLTNCVPPSLCPSLRPSGRKLEISVNIDARTLKFCM